MAHLNLHHIGTQDFLTTIIGIKVHLLSSGYSETGYRLYLHKFLYKW